MARDSSNNATSNGGSGFERSIADQLVAYKSDDDDFDDVLEDSKVLEAEEDDAKDLTQKRATGKSFERSFADQLMSCKSDDDEIDDSLEDSKVLAAEKKADEQAKKADEKRAHEGSEAPTSKKSKKNGDDSN